MEQEVVGGPAALVEALVSACQAKGVELQAEAEVQRIRVENGRAVGVKLSDGTPIDADCVLYNPPMERYDEIIPMLASGKNVVSIMAGWNPKKRSAFSKTCSRRSAPLQST